MKAGWEILPMGQLCTIQSGKSDTKDAVPDGLFAFFDRSKTIKRSNRYLRDCEALIIPGEGTEFLPRHFSGKFDLHQRAYAIFDFSPKLDARFLFYYLHHVSDYFPRVAVGATVKSLRLRHFEDLPVSVTALVEQKRIVARLDEAFAHIATAKANAEQNLQNARAVFDSHLQSVFAQREHGWVEKRFGDLATFRNGVNFTKSSKGQSLEIVGVKDFQKHFWAPTADLDVVTIEGELPDSDLLAENDILFVRSNGNPELIGRCLLIGAGSGATSFSGFTIRARLNDSSVKPIYLCHFLKSKRARRTMIDGGNGVNIRSLNQGTLSNLVIPFPPITVQAKIVRKLEKLSTETQRLESIYQQKLTALDALKKSLLHQAFSGQL